MRKHKGIILALGGLMALGFAGGARADLPMTYAQQAAISPSGASLRDIAVNRNKTSPYYGYVYATNVTGVKVHILRPSRPEDGSGAPDLVDTGLTITASGSTNLFGVAVGDDDSVWLGVFGSGNIETAPPVPPAGETNVTAVKQFSVTGGIRSIAMRGTLDAARVFIQTNDVKMKSWEGSTTSWDTTGTFTEHKVVDLKATIHATAVQIGYGIGSDSAGNAYVGLSYNLAGAAAPLVAKIDWDGNVDAAWGGKRPPFTAIANSLADAEVVEDDRLPGGGYVYYRARQQVGSPAQNKAIVHRFRLDNGAWLDSFGPAAVGTYNPPTDATYTVLEVDNAASPHYFTADDKGNLYLNSGNQTTITKVVASQPFMVENGQSNSAGAVIKSSPTIVDGVAYFGASDGKLYAYTVADGNPLDGFPVDVAEQLEQPNEKILGRPAVYITAAGKGIYFTTSGGYVCRLDEDGGNLRFGLVPLNTGGVNAAPAVHPDGTVYVGLYDGTAARVYRFNPTLTESMESAALGYGNMTSVAVAGNNVFVGLAAAASKKLVVLNAATLDVLNTFEGEQVTSPPYVSEGNMYFGTLSGAFHKVNAATGVMDMSFGEDGAVNLGAPISASPFVAKDGPFFVPTDAGKVWTVWPDDGHSALFFDTGDSESPIGGVVVAADCLGFGTAAGTFYVVPSGGDSAQVYRGHGPFSGAPAYDAGTKLFVGASEDGNAYTFPRLAPTALPM